jgi:hypothetical protein
MSYRVTVIADFNGNMYVGADKRPIALAAASPIAEVKLYSSQLRFAVSAKDESGRVYVTTRRKAARNGWTLLRDHENRDIRQHEHRDQKPVVASFAAVQKIRHSAMADGIEWCAMQLPDALKLVRDGWTKEASKLRGGS